jgi:hypothetical protein
VRERAAKISTPIVPWLAVSRTRPVAWDALATISIVSSTDPPR